MHLGSKALFTALALAAAGPAFAQVTAPEANIDTLPRFGAASDWRVTVGAAAFAAPVFDGADTLRVRVFPDVDVRWKDRFFASVRTGAGWNAIQSDGWRAGPYVKLDFGRDESRAAALRGLGDVDPALEAGAFAEKTWRFARASVEVRRGLAEDRGTVAEAGADLRFRLSERVAVSVGPRLRIADADRLAVYYGVDPGQSARSGLPRYAPSGGLESAGLSAAIVLRPRQAVTVTLFGEQSRLLDDAAASPLVRLRGSEDQTRFGVSVGARLGKR